METEVSTVHPETHIYVAMNLMVKEGISGLPVINVNQRLVGFLSEKEILQMLVSGESSDEQTVRNYMVDKVKTFKTDDSAVDVCEYFMNNPVHIAPVVNEDGEYAGVVRRRDIIFLILRLRGKIYRKKK
jgi:CBS-domain-containing membrane protein